MSYSSANASLTASSTSLVIDVYRLSSPPSSSAIFASLSARSLPDRPATAAWAFFRPASDTGLAALPLVVVCCADGDPPQATMTKAATMPIATTRTRFRRMASSPPLDERGGLWHDQ